MTWSQSFSGIALIFVKGVNNCGESPISSGFQVTVNPKPVVSYSLCTDSITTTKAKPFSLKGGIQLNGIYSGPGVNSVTGVFTPLAAGVGTHTITYTYMNAYGCSTTAQKQIKVVSPVSFLCGNPFIDIPGDNKQYQTIGIGTQCWMADNLNYGTRIDQSNNQRDNCIVEKYCYSDLSSNCTNDGGLIPMGRSLMAYNPVAGTQGLCPPEWHMPSEVEWNKLFNNYINNGFAGNALKYTGYSGFDALLSGVGFFNKTWNYSDFAGFFWSGVSHGPYKAWAHAMNTYNPSVSYYPSSRSNAFSVRCIKD